MKCRKCHAELPEGAKYCHLCGARQDVRQNPKSRGNGTGSVYQLANKRWIAVRTIGYERDEKGKRMRKISRSKSGFRTKKEAIEALATLGTERPQPRATLLQVYEAWLPTHQAGKDTINCYKAAKKYLAPVYHINLRDISVDDLQECLDECPKGKRTRQNMKTLIGLLYKYAIPRNLASLNMSEYLTVHAEAAEERNALPEDAIPKLTKHLEDVPGADYVLCQCYLGFRPSELLALDIKDYDRKERAFVGGAKTEAGTDRVVTVSPKIQPIVDRLVRDKLSGPVFSTTSGGRMDIKTYRTLFYDVLEKCGIENPIERVNGVDRHRYTPHSCRHTFATLMKRVQADTKDKLALIGHTSEEMLRYYQDVSLEDLRKITDAL